MAEPTSPEPSPALVGLPEHIRACFFDLDGVLADTIALHIRVWKSMFDQYLAAAGESYRPFDAASDYRCYVDGRRRDDGVRAFLASRGLTLPDGQPTDPPDAGTVWGLGNRKNAMFLAAMHADGIAVFDGSRRYLTAVAAAGLRIAVVSSSANTRAVLHSTGLEQYVQVRVDGVTLRTENIPGKPAPDPYLRAAELLGVRPAQGAVFEDALSGVAAGRAGHFGYIVGVDRLDQAGELRRCGADVVVADLADLLAGS